MSFTLFLEALSGRLHIPDDIVKIIAMFYSNIYPLSTINFIMKHSDTTFLLCYRQKDNLYGYTTTFLWQSYNVTSQKYYSQIVDKGLQTKKNKMTFDIDPSIIIRNCRLPAFTANKFNNFPDNDHKISEELSSSRKWSLIFQFKGPSYAAARDNLYLSLFHYDLLTCDICNIYQLSLPKPPYISLYNPSIVYDDNKQTLYAMHMGSHLDKSINKLNLNSIKELQWQQMDDLSIYRKKASVCMVDNNRFIGIFGGDIGFSKGSTLVELYAINCEKSIRLNDSNLEYMSNAKSLYNDKLHRIVLSEISGMRDSVEWYDINKDKWITHKLDILRRSKAMNGYGKRKQDQIWFYRNNPYILCRSFIHEKNWNKREYKFGVETVDLRVASHEEQEVNWMDAGDYVITSNTFMLRL